MGGGLDRKPGASSLIHDSPTSDATPLGAGKQTLTEQLPSGPVQLRTEVASGTAQSAEQTREIAAQGVSGTGGTLPHRDQIAQSFGPVHGATMDGIQAHVGGNAASAAREIGAQAYATRNSVAFASTPDLHTAAHEAAHVVQQRAGVQLKGGVGAAGDAYEQHADAVADAVVQGKSAEALLDRYAGGSATASTAVQRYESGEHAKIGDTHEELAKAYAPIQYTVEKGDTLESIAGKFKISVDELKAANRDKLKKLPGHGGKAKVDGFMPGDQIAVPQKLNEMARDAVKDTTVKVTVNGVTLDYGTLVAMGGDLFGSPEELAKASPEELKALATLIEEEKKTGKSTDTTKWQAATKGRYLDLAAKNEAHFAPPNADFVAVSGQSGDDHKHSWETNHRKALDASRAGEKDKALMINAFGDHFLTDAFSAGHLFNKRDVMEKFNAQLPTTGTGNDREFTKPSEKFFDAIAQTVFVGDVAAEFSKYETVERHYGFHPNINSASRFSTLLQGIHLEKPELLESAVAKGVHDQLNDHPGGIMVDNALGEKWPLSGDGTLNAQSLAVSRKAVAQSQQNVISVFQSTSPPDYPALFKRVWDFTPRPTADGKKEITGAISTGTDVNNASLRSAIVNLIKANYKTILAELVKLHKLRLA